MIVAESPSFTSAFRTVLFYDDVYQYDVPAPFSRCCEACK